MKLFRPQFNLICQCCQNSGDFVLCKIWFLWRTTCRKKKKGSHWAFKRTRLIHSASATTDFLGCNNKSKHIPSYKGNVYYLSVTSHLKSISNFYWNFPAWQIYNWPSRGPTHAPKKTNPSLSLFMIQLTSFPFSAS